MPFRFQIATAALLLLGPPAATGVYAQGTAPAHPQGAAAGSIGSSAKAAGPLAANRPLLPAAFAGQPREGDIVIDPTPSTVDAAHSELLKEDGMVEASVARYGGINGKDWTLQAIRFGDTTGAFAAFTFYRSPDMRAETIGDAAAASAHLFLVQRGAMLVIARLADGVVPTPSRVRPEIKALVSGLPRTYGPSAIPPPLPGLLPVRGLDRLSLHYAIGPVGYNGPLPASSLSFDKDAEVVTAAYHLPGSPTAVMTLDMLPTPELAAASLQAIQALPDASLHVSTRRLGTLVEVVSGKGLAGAATQPLLAKVRYAPAVTLDIARSAGPTTHSEVVKTAQLFLGVAEFTGVMAVGAVLLAGFFGFGRVYIRRLRGKPDSSLYDDDFISLRLK